MNRRTFLKSIAIACGAAVVCPGELLKDEPVEVKPGWYDFNPFGSEAERKKYRQNIFIKARQQGITTPYMRWKDYFTAYKPPVNTKLLDELTNAIKNTKFHPPFRILS